MPPEIRAFQIFYDQATRASLDRDFEPMDNTASEGAGWYEYWPIRNYLSRNELDESAFYGFLSPRFSGKTGLSGAKVKDFVTHCEDADVVTFSPFPCHGACFLNVFEHGDFFHRGLFEAAARFFEKVDPGIKLGTLVMHSRNIVFSNFFLARRKFWKAWKAVLDLLFEFSETPGMPMYASLNQEVAYLKGNGDKSFMHMKIFVMERAASFLLASGAFRVKNFPPFAVPLCPQFTGRLPDVVTLDALKIAFAESADAKFLELFRQMRDRVVADTWLADARRQAG